jgi:hypothetical protein
LPAGERVTLVATAQSLSEAGFRLSPGLMGAVEH